MLEKIWKRRKLDWCCDSVLGNYESWKVIRSRNRKSEHFNWSDRIDVCLRLLFAYWIVIWIEATCTDMICMTWFTEKRTVQEENIAKSAEVWNFWIIGHITTEQWKKVKENEREGKRTKEKEREGKRMKENENRWKIMKEVVDDGSIFQNVFNK